MTVSRRNPFSHKSTCAVICIVLALLQGCALIERRPFTSAPFKPGQVDEIISRFLEQYVRVTSFIKDKHDSMDVISLVVGRRSPAKMMKIELTHPWGRPLVHILIKGETVHILSFPEKRYYVSSIEDLEFARTLPGSGGKFSQVWGLLRGFPVLQDYASAESSQGRSISLLTDDGKRNQIIRFYPEENLPAHIFYPGSWTELFFSDFTQSNGIVYSRKIKAVDQGSGTEISLKIEKMIFNKPVPESVFEIRVPEGFQSTQPLP